VLVGVCWFGSVALMDRSAGAGIDLIMGLATIATIDRLIARGPDLRAGALAALAFLTGGWPPLAVIAMTVIALGRAGAGFSWRLVLPPILTFACYSAWALSKAPAEVLAAALTLPLTHKPAWFLVCGVLALGLPWTPFALFCAAPSARAGWSNEGRGLVFGWLQAAGACLLGGTLVPGLAQAAELPALAGLAILAAAGCDRFVAGSLSPRVARYGFAVATGLLLAWAVFVTVGGGYVAAAVPYYRSLCVILMVTAVPAAGLAIWASSRRRALGAIASVIALSVFLKLAHYGCYVPEWNYRLSQGPWGRAAGQWVPPRWPIYTMHTWRTDLAFATEHPVRQLPSPQHLQFVPGQAKFVLLAESEFENWPAHAPPLIRIASFQDEFGSGRVVARTEGPLPWDVFAVGRDNR
jgi:hypothetical protein